MAQRMIDGYLPGWQKLQIDLLKGVDPDTGEPFYINARLDITHRTDGHGRPSENEEIRCRIRVWGPEGNLHDPEIEHIIGVVRAAREQDILHGLMAEVTNSGMQIKDVLLDS